MRISCILNTILVAAGLFVAGCATHAPPANIEPEPPAAARAPDEEDTALVTTAEHLARQARGTPAWEYANRICARDTKECQARLLLKGEQNDTEQDLGAAREIMKAYIRRVQRAGDWPLPLTYRAPYASIRPVMDGILDEPVWKRAERWESMYRMEQTEPVQSPKTRWRIMWDDKNLYFGIECADTDIRAPEADRDEERILTNDCVNLFLLPEHRTRTYWQIAVSPTKSVYDGLHSKRPERCGTVIVSRENMQGLAIGVELTGSPNEADHTDVRYVLELAIPFDELPEWSMADPRTEQDLYVMLTRTERTRKKSAIFTYQPLFESLHNIWNYGKVELVR